MKQKIFVDIFQDDKYLKTILENREVYVDKKGKRYVRYVDEDGEITIYYLDKNNHCRNECWTVQKISMNDIFGF